MQIGFWMIIYPFGYSWMIRDVEDPTVCCQSSIKNKQNIILSCCCQYWRLAELNSGIIQRHCFVVEAVTRLGAEVPIPHLPWSKVLYPSTISQVVSSSPFGAWGPFSHWNLHTPKHFLSPLSPQAFIHSSLPQLIPLSGQKWCATDQRRCENELDFCLSHH